MKINTIQNTLKPILRPLVSKFFKLSKLKLKYIFQLIKKYFIKFLNFIFCLNMVNFAI